MRDAVGIAEDADRGLEAAHGDHAGGDGERLADLVAEEKRACNEGDKQNANRPSDNSGFPAHLPVIKKSIE